MLLGELLTYYLDSTCVGLLWTHGALSVYILLLFGSTYCANNVVFQLDPSYVTSM